MELIPERELSLLACAFFDKVLPSELKNIGKEDYGAYVDFDDSCNAQFFLSFGSIDTQDEEIELKIGFNLEWDYLTDYIMLNVMCGASNDEPSEEARFIAHRLDMTLAETNDMLWAITSRVYFYMEAYAHKFHRKVKTNVLSCNNLENIIVLGNGFTEVGQRNHYTIYMAG